MNPWKSVERHSSDWLAAFDIALALGLAAYGALFSYYLAHWPIPVFFRSWCDLLLVVLIVIGLLKIKLTADVREAAAEEGRRAAEAALAERQRLTQRHEEKTKAVVTRLLEATVKTLAFTHADPLIEIRAFCHRYNATTDALEPYVAWGYEWHSDADRIVPCNHPKSEKFVIVKAFKESVIKQENVGRDGVEDMPVDVWPDLKCVLAAPLRNFKPDSHPEQLGVINFDANRTLAEVHFDGKQAREICRLYAGAIYDLLKE